MGEEERIRLHNRAREREKRPSNLMGAESRADTRRIDGMPSLRQSTVRESLSLVRWYAYGQHERLREQGTKGESPRKIKADALHPRAQVHRREYKNKDSEQQKTPTMPRLLSRVGFVKNKKAPGSVRHRLWVSEPGGRGCDGKTPPQGANSPVHSRVRLAPIVGVPRPVGHTVSPPYGGIDKRRGPCLYLGAVG